ncbi:hypothetical protein J4233_03500 [Candidatus Pacearchaeota archaeon]|nr:hypothetical protein [Candidatus Pacearchaeota archaeon]
MRTKELFAAFVVIFLVGTIFSSSFSIAAMYSSRSAVSATYQPAPSFQTTYGSQASTYWPILGNKDTCDSREDFMLQVAPFGCEPKVVRSDLLAEQDVPVFCQINAIDINPLIKVNQIKNIDFTVVSGSDEVLDVGFHPARAALRTQSTLLGSPLVNNIGYAVVLLKRQPEEAKLPDSVNVTLQARISYDADNAYGIGRSDFILEPTSFEDWQSEKLKSSFWNGRYFVRLENADENYAEVSIYEGDRKAITTRVQKGQTSREFFVPGMYCRAGVSVAYDSYVAAQKKARIEVSSGSSYDSFDVYEGSNFLDGRCSVKRIELMGDGESGKVIGTCSGKQFVLELKTKGEGDASSIFIDGKSYSIEEIGGRYWIDLNNNADSTIKGEYYFDGENLVKGDGTFIMNSTSEGTLSDVQKKFFNTVYGLIKIYAGEKSGNAVKPQYTEHYDNAIESYERVADDYPSENDGIYGKEALQKAINLARGFGDDKSQARLSNRYIGLYPGDAMTESYQSELESLRQFDSSLSGEAIEFDNSVKVLRLVSLSEPAKKASADFTVQGRGMRMVLGSSYDLKNGDDKKVGTIKLNKVEVDKVEVGVSCIDTAKKDSVPKTETRPLKVDEAVKPICGVDVKLDSVDVEKSVKIRLIPSAQGGRTETNMTVFVGIEKRAIQLTPDKVNEKIENLNKTIQKWQKIADNLGKVVSGLKGACFATATLLTFKNFMTGLSGEAIARQEVMNGENGWTERCKELVPKTYPTMDACYIAKSSEIDSEISRTTAAMNKVNAKIQQIQNTETKSTDIFGKSVDTDAVRKKLAAQIKADYPGMTIDLGDNTWKNADGTESKTVRVEELLSEENVNNSLISTEAMRSLMLNAELQRQGTGLGEGQAQNVNGKLTDVAMRVNENMIVNQEFKQSKENEKKGYPSVLELSSQHAPNFAAPLKPLTAEQRTETGLIGESTHFAVISVPNGVSTKDKGGVEKSFGTGVYYLGLKGNPQTGNYGIMEVTKQSEPGTKIDPVAFTGAYGLGNVKSLDSTSYQNEIQSSDRHVRYYEMEPYKGMPAIVPFDTKAGWYAATQQTLPAFGGIGAFDASGRVTSFWICNVGKNGKIQFDSGFGDDLCQQINMNTGQPLNAFPGLDSGKATILIQRGQQAIMEAAKQYGNKFVSIGGERFEVGKPMTGTPSTQCQDFMSPKDCHLMFNVCDPVVCPPSRCNLGGTYYVANVAQTGIIGSIFLCLPNIREGIMIPVCLTGIHAGIEGWISILKNFRDCLQNNLDTGQMTGICDEVYSIYLCEFFWNQVAPIVNILIPKLIEMAYGQGVRGGAEYLSVMGAWQNMQNSVDYFTQSYAVNSFTAFKAGNLQDIGSEVCKSFISIKAPTKFDTLLQPDSPPQFHAWFDEKTFTTATVPATSQYKLFYHIFAGNDQGVQYSVYLRDPPTSGYYAANPTVSVASGFIATGEYKSETKDFTAPQGYKELCVRINRDEKCGFKQVSTSFAVNYLRDSYIKSEASKVTITSQKECVSGSNNPAALLNPNVQAGVEETVSPEIYNRGIIRICSTDNPGSQTDPSRYVDVGYCDQPKIRCWIDQRSVEQAITQGNVGTLDETLEVLDARAKEMLDAQGQTLEVSAVENELMLLKSDVAKLGSIDAAKLAIDKANALFEKLFWNRHKAQVLIIRGDAQAYIAWHYKGAEDEEIRGTRVVDENGETQQICISSKVEVNKDNKVTLGGILTSVELGSGVVTATNINGETLVVMNVGSDGTYQLALGIDLSKYDEDVKVVVEALTGKKPETLQQGVITSSNCVSNPPAAGAGTGTTGSVAPVCTARDVVVENNKVKVGGAETGVEVSAQGATATNSDGNRITIFEVVNGAYQLIRQVDLSKLSADQKKVAEALEGRTPQALANNEIKVTECTEATPETGQAQQQEQAQLPPNERILVYGMPDTVFQRYYDMVFYSNTSDNKLTYTGLWMKDGGTIIYLDNNLLDKIRAEKDSVQVGELKSRFVKIDSQAEFKSIVSGYEDRDFAGIPLKYFEKIVRVNSQDGYRYRVEISEEFGKPASTTPSAGTSTNCFTLGNTVTIINSQVQEILFGGEKTSLYYGKGAQHYIIYSDNLQDYVYVAYSKNFDDLIGYANLEVTKTDKPFHNIFEKLKGNSYRALEDSSNNPICPSASLDSAPAQTQQANEPLQYHCDECGDGWFNTCDYDECKGKGGGDAKCYFVSGTFSGSCSSCANVKSCEGYPSETRNSCENNDCSVPSNNCVYDRDNGKCKSFVSGTAGTGAADDGTNGEAGTSGTTNGAGTGGAGTDGAASGKDILPRNERLKAILLNNGQYGIFYQLRRDGESEGTYLFVKQGALAISYTTSDNVVARLDKPLSASVSEVIISPSSLVSSSDITFGEGEDAIKLSEFARFERKDSNTFSILVTSDGQTCFELVNNDPDSKIFGIQYGGVKTYLELDINDINNVIIKYRDPQSGTAHLVVAEINSVFKTFISSGASLPSDEFGQYANKMLQKILGHSLAELQIRKSICDS